MASLELLPATVYKPASATGQVPRRRPSLNTIIEVDEDSHRGSNLASKMQIDRGRNRSPQDKSPKSSLTSWHLSPLSDHFPTPRGNHFLSAPICPSTSGSSNTDTGSPATSSDPWTRQSFMTDATDFDDLYDASSDEDARKSTIARRPSTRYKQSKRLSTGSRASRESLTSLVIPKSQDQWAGVNAFKLLTSPVPPTPPPKMPMSPAMLSYLQSQEAPSSSAPPSLDGSLNSEELAAISAPPTPNIGNNSEDEGEWGGGVQLQPDAMATLRALAGANYEYDNQPEQVIEVPSRSNSPMREMQQSPPPLITNIRRHNSIILSPATQRSLNSLTKLEIPSPGGFFSGLSSNARHTWHLVPITPESAAPPSSSTAESFYKTPWQAPPVEQIVEVPEMSETVSEGMLTARPTTTQLSQEVSRPGLRHDNSDDTICFIPSPQLIAEEEIIVDEMIRGDESGYARKLEDVAVVNLDRTGMWLATQSDFLAELINPTEARDDEAALLQRVASFKSQKEEAAAGSRRKTVRFSEIAETSEGLSVDVTCPKPIQTCQENAYLRGFQHLIARSRYRDTFVHRLPRFEALQAQRVSFPIAHRAHLLGKYQLSVVPMSAKRRMSANVARGDEIAPEDPEKFKSDREAEAVQQIASATWNVMAVKLLNGGRLIAAPVAKRLARLSTMGLTASGAPRDRARILDLGGQATCDWAWHCATEYPNTKVYTVTTKALRQLSNSNIRGPKNHRQVAIERLTKLPFKDNRFDLISAREVYTILKQSGENGEDEWDGCLAECMRILKPGGYLEFSLMDSDIVNAGPIGLAKSVEFGFNLKTLGYDPVPTKTFLPRLKKAGFVKVKRAWVFLPMGSKVEKRDVDRDSKIVELEAMVTGTTEAAASISGVVGGWAWEKWLLRCKVQTVGEQGRVEGVQDIIEEGRAGGAGWRTLSGWAKKPL
ncbi:hypothetical protein BJ878DRAFT_322461 [Calycina marina]|uniref:Methyltransferase type 11 domain-containing protein n=1 Tax=Calycina marina TaxID=1763456 RepID=A0A9P7Z6V8_9HELO|nr:hypothetical protein BJ878DRAFT_322461 [Calycina marina]